MKMSEVGFHKETIDSITKYPLIRDNIKNMETDFCNIYSKMLTTDLPEEIQADDMIKMKSDIFAAFCHGVMMGTKLDSRFRQGFKLPEEFDPQKQIVDPQGKIITS